MPSVRPFAATGALGALVLTVSALVNAPDTPDKAGFSGWNIASVLSFVALIVGLIGLVRSGAAGTGTLARIGLALAFAGIAFYTVIEIMVRYDTHAADRFHPIAVPLTALAMLLTGIATLRAHRLDGWRRLMPLLCGIVPFVVELPGFILLGDEPALQYVIAFTWACWLALNTAVLTAPVRASVSNPVPVG